MKQIIGCDRPSSSLTSRGRRRAIPATFIAAFLSLACGSARADYVWGGGSNDWYAAAAWTGGSAPARWTGDNVTISSGTCTYPGNEDLTMSGTLTVNGTGTFIQYPTGNWFDLNGDIVVEGGGVFDTGAAGLFRTRKGVYVRNGGTVVFRCNAGIEDTVARLYLQDGGNVVCSNGWTAGARTLLSTEISGGVFRGPGSGTFTVADYSTFTGGTVTGFESVTYSRMTYLSGTTTDVSRLIATSPTPFVILSGELDIDYNATDNGFTASNGANINFPARSTGRIVVRNFPSDKSAFDIYGGRIRSGGAALTQDLWIERINEVVADGTLVLTSLYEGGETSFVEGSCSLVRRENGNAVISATVEVATEESDTWSVYLVYGSVDGGTDTVAKWENSQNLGTAVNLVSYTGNVPLGNADEVYYRMALVNSNPAVATRWAVPCPYTAIPSADTAYWLGGDDFFSTAGKWSTGSVPNGGATIRIENGTVSYNNSADWNYWGSLTLANGGTLDYVSGNWPQIRWGSIDIRDGGSLLFPTPGCVNLYNSLKIRIRSGGTMSLNGTTGWGGENGKAYITLDGGTLAATQNWRGYQGNNAKQACLIFSSGTANIAGDYYSASGDTFTGGVMNVGASLHVVDSIEIAGTEVNVGSVVHFESEGVALSLSAGSITLAAAGTADYYGFDNNRGYLDIISTGTGVLRLANTEANASLVYSRYFAGESPHIRIDGAVADRQTFSRYLRVQADESEPTTACVTIKPIIKGMAVMIR